MKLILTCLIAASLHGAPPQSDPVDVLVPDAGQMVLVEGQMQPRAVALAKLREMLAQAQPSDEAVRLALRLGTSIAGQPRVMEKLKELATGESEQSTLAMLALTHVPAPDIAPVFVEGLDAAAPEARLFASVGLLKTPERPLGEYRAAVESLVRLLSLDYPLDEPRHPHNEVINEVDARLRTLAESAKRDYPQPIKLGEDVPDPRAAIDNYREQVQKWWQVHLEDVLQKASEGKILGTLGATAACRG